MMINLPTFASEVFVFLLLSNFIILYLLWIAFGGIFTFSVDVTGRPIYVPLVRKIISTIGLLGVLTYFAIELVLCARFLPYWVEQGQTDTQVITALSISRDPAGTPVAYWITTQTHRFGVSEDIYSNVWVGEKVEFRYRPSDDTLFAIGPAPTPGKSTPSVGLPFSQATPSLTPSPSEGPKSSPSRRP